MTTRRFLYVDTDLTAPPSPTGLPEGYAIITKIGQMFVIRDGVFKPASGGGTQVRTGLPDATGTAVTIGGVLSLFSDASTSAPTGYQADSVNDTAQTYGETTAPTPPTGVTAYTAIQPKGNASAGFHVIYPDNDARLGRGAKVTFKYRFDGYETDGLQFSFFAAVDDPPLRLFGAKGNPGVGGPTDNTQNWQDGSFYFPPGGGSLFLYTAQVNDEGSNLDTCRILITDLVITPFDLGDQGNGWYDDSTGTQYLYDNGWIRTLDSYTLARAQHGRNSYQGDFVYTTQSDVVIPIASAAVAPPTGVTATPVSGGQLHNGSTYYWKITSLSARGESLGSTEVSAAIAAFPNTTRKVVLQWDLNPAAVGYRIYRSDVSGGELYVDEVEASTFQYQDGGTRGRPDGTPIPTSDSTATGPAGTTHVRVGPLCNLFNTYRSYVSDATAQTYRVYEQVDASLSIKHSGALPSLMVELVAHNVVDQTEKVIAKQLHEDLVTGKYRGIGISGAFQINNGVDAQDIDYLVRVSSPVDGTVTVLTGSTVSFGEQFV